MSHIETVEIESRPAFDPAALSASDLAAEVDLQLKLLRGQGILAAELGTDDLVAILGLPNSEALRKRRRERYPFLRVEGKRFCATTLEVARYLAAKSIKSHAALLGAMSDGSTNLRG